MQAKKVGVAPKNKPQAYLCFFCKKPAPYGMGYGGLNIPQHRHGYMWVCKEHIEDAQARIDEARRKDNPLYRSKKVG